MSACWLNGRPSSTVAINNRGLLYGDGVFRTALVWQGQVVALAPQLEKLMADADSIGLAFAAGAELEACLIQQAQKHTEAVFRISLVAGDSARGYARSVQPCHWIVQQSPLPQAYTERARQGLRLCGLSWQLGSQPALAGVKHLNRLDQVLARRQLPPHGDEGLLRNQAGDWVSGIMSNLFWFADGHWHTPALKDCGVAGLVRSRIIKHLANSNAPAAVVSRCRDQDLQASPMIFVCNSVMGLVPVRSWRDRDDHETHWSADSIQSFAAFHALTQHINHPLNHA